MVNKTAAFLLLGAIASEVLASTNFSSNSRSVFNKRSESDWVCSSDDTPSLMLTHFAAVFFGDFTTTGGQDILGPLAVGGKFTANHYTVNVNQSPKCSDGANNIKDYALVVDGKVDADEVRLKGNAQVPEGSTGLVETIDTCKVYKGGKSIYDFNLARQNALSASETFARMRPNMILRSDGTLSSLRESVDGFHVLTFSTCNEGSCDLIPGQMSDPSALLQGKGNWNGPKGMSWPKTGTLVLNIPVESGSTFTLLGNLVTQGMDPCRTIFNFYSSKNGGISSGSFTLKRHTGSNLGAFVLAPRANIIDGSTGAFAGTVVGNNYSWGGSGIEIHNYKAAGGSCDTFEGCLPIVPPKKTTTTSTAATTTTTSIKGATPTTSTTVPASTTTTHCTKSTCKNTTTTAAVPTTTCTKSTCKSATTTAAVPATTCTKSTCKSATTTAAVPATTCTNSTCKNTTTTNTAPCNHHKTTKPHNTTTTSNSHHKTTAPCNHHSTTRSKPHTKGTSKTCGCQRHSTSAHHHSAKKTCSHHAKKTTTAGHHGKKTTHKKKGITAHHGKKTTCSNKKTTTSHHAKKTTCRDKKTSHVKKHKTTTAKHKAHTPGCSNVCPSGCGTKTVTKVIYVTAN